MDVANARELLAQLSSSEGSVRLPADHFASPPPWVDFYPPTKFLPAFDAELQMLAAGSVHYVGLADESILRFLAAMPLRLSVMDVVNWWGVEEGDIDADNLFSEKSRLPKDLERIRFYIEGSSKWNDGLIVDVRSSRNLISGMRYSSKLNPDRHCVALLGPALEMLNYLPEYEWKNGDGFSIGVYRKPS